MRRICVFGAGAVGGNLAVRLAEGGAEVSVVARGTHLAAIRERGLTLIAGGRRRTVRVAASDDPAKLGEQDAVISTLKAPSLPALASSIAPLLGPDTPVVFAINGIPWWYFEGVPDDGRRRPDLSRLDPGGALARVVGARRTIGAVIYSPNVVAGPGVIDNVEYEGQRLEIGELDGESTPRLAALAARLEAGGMRTPITPDIRRDVWKKLLANVGNSTLAAIVGARNAATVADPALQAVARALRIETAAAAAAWGIGLDVDPAAHPPVVRPEAGHKPSMLQDLEAGRTMEVDAIALAPLAFARAAGIPAPTLETVGALLAARARVLGLHDG